MTHSGKPGTRWIAPLLTAALLASAGVGYAIVRITAPSNGDDDGATATLTTTSPSPLPTTVIDRGTSTGAGPVTPSLPSPTSNPDDPATEPVVPPSSSSDLAGSDIQLPAGWSGTAIVTVTVLGQCAPDEPSVYLDLPVDLAIDLVGNEAHTAEVALDPSVRPDTPTLTLGINPNAVPSLAVYTSQLDEAGEWHRYWDLELEPGPNWTEIHGTLVQLPSEGMNPNMMVDTETAQLACESTGTVSLPRVLTAGSTLDGWVTRTRAKLTLEAVTADGKRQVEVEIDAQRRQ